MLAEPPATALRLSTEKSPSGACGANDCHACTTRFASAHDQASEYVDTSSAGCERKTKRVTIPKFPPPPPRSAQKRSACSLALAVTTRPSANTTVASRRLSQVRPYLRAETPIPPPCVDPAMPTVGHVPPGIIRPDAASAV